MSSCSTVPYKLSIGFIGAGKMAQALAFGFVSAGIVKRQEILLIAPSERNLASLKEQQFRCDKNNASIQLLTFSVVFIAVKPNVVETVLEDIHDSVKHQLFVSVAAGIKLETIERKLPSKARVIRCAPNTAVQFGSGVTVFSRGSRATDDDVELLTKYLRAVGICEEVPEALIDSATGMIGSGTAFVLTMIQSLADGGLKMGIPRHLANSFAAQTFLGAAKMVIESGKHPAILQEEVASPGGTTIHGLHELEKGGLRGTIVSAVEAATKRANELGENVVKKRQDGIGG